MANYLITNYKGKYRIRTSYDLSTNQFPRKLNGTLEDVDCYIDCQKGTRIHHYGNRILEAYIPSLGRGHNIIKAIQSELGEDVIFHIEETDLEVLFRFNSKYMTKLEKYLKPKINGADISPFSSRNLPKLKYIIPDEDLISYKKTIENIPKNQLISLVHITNNFLQSLVTKKNTWEDIKADMALKGLKNKEYIHSIGKWKDYIKHLEKEIN